MQKDIIQTWFLEHPVEAVWEFLTDSELLAQWLMKNNFKPEVGHKFQFKTFPRTKLGFDGNIYCEVLEVVPCKKLSYSWKGGPGNGKINLDTVVTWTLVSRDNGTELNLVQAGFKGVRNYISYFIMDKGWALKMKKRITELLREHQNENVSN